MAVTVSVAFLVQIPSPRTHSRSPRGGGTREWGGYACTVSLLETTLSFFVYFEGVRDSLPFRAASVPNPFTLACMFVNNVCEYS